MSADERIFRAVNGDIHRFTRKEFGSYGVVDQTFEEYIDGISRDYYVEELKVEVLHERRLRYWRSKETGEVLARTWDQRPAGVATQPRTFEEVSVVSHMEQARRDAEVRARERERIADAVAALPDHAGSITPAAAARFIRSDGVI